jgi:hypothetical protein
MVETALEFIQAQRAYLEAAAPLAGKSEMELKEAAEEYLRAAGPYDVALQELRQYLLAAEPSEMIAMELDHTKQLIEALDRGKRVVSRLIERHSLKAQNANLPSGRAEEE